MGDVFRRSWFKRMWTLQEVALADPMKALVLCGKEAISWDSIFRALHCMQSMDFDHHRLILDAVDLYHKLDICLSAKKYGRNMAPLSHLFEGIRKRLSTDPSVLYIPAAP
jgi:hypothetical protein